MRFIILAAACIQLVIAAGQVRYDGDEVIRVQPQTQEQVAFLQKFEGVLDFWTDISSKRPVDIRLTASEKAEIRNLLTKEGFTIDTFIDDVQKYIYWQEKSEVRSSINAMDWTSYHDVDEIHAFIAEISAANSDISEVLDIGTSGEGRLIRCIRIGAPGTNKKGYFMDGGIHAREWIAPAITSWFINELLTNRAQYTDVLAEWDFYICPSLNPDGYTFSRTSTRLWRKTRSDHNSALGCRGVDPNRNYNDHFAGSGTSNDKCSDIYHGPQAFSEPETRAARDFILNSGVNWVIYNAIHSYAQMILTPWGWGYELPQEYPELRRVGDAAAAALTAVHGTPYEVGSVTELLSPGAGGSDDWAYSSGGFKYSYTLEVRDTGRYGFLLPADQIIPTAQETFQAVLAMARNARV